MPRLVLFDIDGTLITDSGASHEAYAIALRTVFSYVAPRAYDFSGRTDPQITFMVLRDGGFSDEQIELGMSDLWDCYLDQLAKLSKKDRIRVFPGIERLLEILSRRLDVTLGLLTGNLEPGARIKLSPGNLNRFFSFGAFGSDSPRREELPPIAVARARDVHGHRFEPRDVVIIGDTVYDIRCGVPHQATTIGVSTGKTSADTLRAENPDFVFETLEPTDEVLAAITGVPLVLASS